MYFLKNGSESAQGCSVRFETRVSAQLNPGLFLFLMLQNLQLSQCVCVSVFQGSLQRGEALHQQGHRPAVCREDRRCGQFHFEPRPEHRR